jgi:hypothetical protein
MSERAKDRLRALLTKNELSMLEALSVAARPPTGRAVARELGLSPTTASCGLARMARAGLVRPEKPRGRAMLWHLDESHPMIAAWLGEDPPMAGARAVEEWLADGMPDYVSD